MFLYHHHHHHRRGFARSTPMRVSPLLQSLAVEAHPCPSPPHPGPNPGAVGQSARAGRGGPRRATTGRAVRRLREQNRDRAAGPQGPQPVLLLGRIVGCVWAVRRRYPIAAGTPGGLAPSAPQQCSGGGAGQGGVDRGSLELHCEASISHGQGGRSHCCRRSK